LYQDKQEGFVYIDRSNYDKMMKLDIPVY